MAQLLVIDYIQRFTTADPRSDRRGSVDKTMDYLRQFTEVGLGIIVVSSVGRQRDAKGKSSYEGLNLASFKESGELEFGADSAFLMAPDTSKGDDAVVLRCVKNRYGEPLDIRLRFDRKRQRFDEEPSMSRPDTRHTKSALADLWGRTQAAEDESWED